MYFGHKYVEKNLLIYQVFIPWAQSQTTTHGEKYFFKISKLFGNAWLNSNGTYFFLIIQNKNSHLDGGINWVIRKFYHLHGNFYR